MSAPGESSGRRSRLESPWIQLGISAACAAGIVAAVSYRRVAASRQAPTPVESWFTTTERPRGLMSLRELIGLLQPAECGIAPWEPGQYSVYELRSRSWRADAGQTEIVRDVRVEVVREARASDAYPAAFGMAFPEMYWLRLQALEAFRRQPSDVYRLANPLDLRVTAATPALSYSDGYIPFVYTEGDPSLEARRELRPSGSEELEVAGGKIACRKYEIVLVATEPGGEDEWIGSLWHSSEVSPLGVVQLRAKQESLLLKESGVADRVAYPQDLAPLLEGISTFGGFCHACHGDSCHESVFPPR